MGCAPLWAVVTAVPKHGVVRDSQLPEFSAEPAHLLIERGDAAIVVLLPFAELRIHRPVLGSGNDRAMRGMKPDHGEERSVRCRGLLNEGNRTVHDDPRIITGQIFGGIFPFPRPIL